MNGIGKVSIALACIGTLSIAALIAVPSADDNGLVSPQSLSGTQGSEVAGADIPARSALATDAAGDARDHSIDSVTGGQARFGSAPAPLPVPGSVPAPWMDITEAGFFSDTATHLDVGLRVASLTEGFPELSPTPYTTRGVDYVVCFGSDGGERCADLNVVPQSTGPLLSGTFSIFSSVCGGSQFNDLSSERPTIAPMQSPSECTFKVPARVTYGAPASIIFEVPKTFAEFDGESRPWTYVRANVSYFWLQPGLMTHWAWSVDTAALPHHHDHVGPAYPAGVADELPSTPMEIRFAPAASALEIVTGPAATVPRGLFFGDHLEKNPLFDLLETAVRDEGSEIVVRQTFAGLRPADAPDFEHMSFARVENGPLVEFGVFHMGEDWHAYAGQCIHTHCLDSTYLKLPVEITEGSPGAMELRVPREYFGNPGPGTRMTFLMTITQEVHPSYYTEGKDNFHWMTFADFDLGTLPYTFTGEAVDKEAQPHDHV